MTNHEMEKIYESLARKIDHFGKKKSDIFGPNVADKLNIWDIICQFSQHFCHCASVFNLCKFSGIEINLVKKITILVLQLCPIKIGGDIEF